MIVLILILALGLRLVNLNQSLWLDEAVQAVVANNSLAFTLEELKGDFHPPLFHFLMHYWVGVFGASEISLRIPSVLFGVGTVLVVFLISREIFSRSSSFIIYCSALLLATAPFHIYYSQEARMYSLGCFFATLSVFYFLRIVSVFDRNSKTENAKLKAKNENTGLKIRYRYYLGYFISAVCLIYSDYYGLLVLLTQTAYLLIKKKYKFLLICTFFLILVYLPWTPMFIKQIETGMSATQTLPAWGKLVNLSFIKALPLTFIKFSLGRITVFNKKLYALTALGVFGLFGMVSGCGFLKMFKVETTKAGKLKKANYLIIFLWLVVPVLLAWLASLVIPNYQPFRLLLVLPAFYLILTYGIATITSKFVFLLVTVLIFEVNIFSLLVYYKNSYFWREDWRGVTGLVKKENRPLIISSQTFGWPLNYYQVGDRVVNVVPGTKPVELKDIPAFLEKLSGEKKVFYTPYLADLYDPQKLIVKWLEKDGFVKIKEISFNQIPLWIYSK